MYITSLCGGLLGEHIQGLNESMNRYLDYEKLYDVLKNILRYTQAQIRNAFVWIQKNPEKTLLIALAVHQASKGDYSELLKIFLTL